MENETELEEAKRARRNAEARLVQYEARHPGEYGSTFDTLCRLLIEAKRQVSEATSRLNCGQSVCLDAWIRLLVHLYAD